MYHLYMKKLKLSGRFILTVLFFFAGLFTYSCKKTGQPPVTVNAIVEVYPSLPGNQYMSDRYEVSISGGDSSKSSYVYKDPNNDERWFTLWPSSGKYLTIDNHFTTFSFSGKVTVQIKLPNRTSISSAIVHPLSKNISASVNGNIISIPLAEPANLYVEIDGENKHPLFVFANAQEVNVPSPHDPNVVYFGPGIHEIGYSGGTMQSIVAGKTVYIAGGAYVKGTLMTTETIATTTIRGRGILSGIAIPGYHAYNGMIDAHSGKVAMEGVILLDAPQGYQGIIAWGSGSLLRNVKMIGWAMESDAGGLGTNSQIINCFFKINDDVLKPNQSGMIFKDNIVWQQMCGSVIMLGWNSTGPINNPIVSGLDVVGCDVGGVSNTSSTTLGIINLKNSNGAVYSGVTIENVRLEQKPFLLFGIDIKVTDPGFINNPNYNKGLGSVDGITFRNISVPSTPVRVSWFNGNGNVTTGSIGDIKNVTFENITISGSHLTEQNATTYITRMGNTSNFTYK
jgi:hypothetical protein